MKVSSLKSRVEFGGMAAMKGHEVDYIQHLRFIHSVEFRRKGTKQKARDFFSGSVHDRLE